MPAFALDGGWLLVTMRGLFVAALLAAFGSAVFAVLVAPRALAGAAPKVAGPVRRRLAGLASITIWAALAQLLAWFGLQTVDLAGSLAAAPDVLGGTSFGHVAAAQAALLLGAGVSRWPRLALGLLGVALCLHAGHGHGWAMREGASLLLAAGMAHLLAAGAWLGGLPPLLLMVRTAPAQLAAAAARWFSPLGKACVVAMAASSAVQFWRLIGGLGGLLGTGYGWMAMLKLSAFAGLVALAALNRYRLAPALLRNDPQCARRALTRSIAVQTGLGLLAVLAAAVLSNLPPAVHRGMAM